MNNRKLPLDIELIGEDSESTLAFKEELECILGFADAFLRLQTELAHFEEKLDHAFDQNEFIDRELARKLYVTSCALFRICQRAPFEPHVPFSLAAISYFVRSDDGKDDFKDIDGFDDDHKVLNFIISHFQLEEKIKSEVQIMKEKESQSA